MMRTYDILTKYSHPTPDAKTTKVEDEVAAEVTAPVTNNRVDGIFPTTGRRPRRALQLDKLLQEMTAGDSKM